MRFNLFRRRAPDTEPTAEPARDAVTPTPSPSDDGAWAAFLGGSEVVDSMTALKIGAVFRCVDLISKTMASLPLHLFESADGKRKDKAVGHPLYNLVYVLPNEYTTAYEFWQMFTANLLLTRGGFAKIERNGFGQVTAMWNIPTACVSGVHRTPGGSRYIRVTTAEGSEVLMAGEYLHVPGFRFGDDISPNDPISLAAKILGMANDVNSLSGAAFRNGVNPGGFLETPNGLSDKAYERLKTDFNRKYTGVQNAGRTIILEEGAKFQMVDRDLEKTQALAARKFAVTEICRVFGVPPHLCMDLEHATFTNIEQQSLEFVRDCVNPISVRMEQAMYRDLLTPRECGRYFFKFNTNGLLRGDTAARVAYYNSARQNGWLNADEIRALEDMNPLPEGQGGELYTVNGNMISLANVPLNIPKGAQKGATP